MTAHIPTDHEIETYSGLYVDVSAPQPDTINLFDIAHALAQICRYGGHCQEFYSVAEHAVLVSKRLERQRLSVLIQLAGLHHDDSEAYLVDIPRPMKRLLGIAYGDLTERMDAAVVEGLQLPFAPDYFHDPAIKDADNWSLFVEARHLLPSQGRQWWRGGQEAQEWGIENVPARIVTPDYWRGGLTPRAARDTFIGRHNELVERISA